MSQDKEPNESYEPGQKDFWDKLRAIGPIVVAIAVSAVGGWYNYQQARLQTESQKRQTLLAQESHRRQVFTQLLAQRERADSDLRANMFNTLFSAYFGKSISWKEELNLSTISRQVMFLDLLARNFETIDIKPLFEDLDRRLTEAIHDPQIPIGQKRCCFKQREILRRVGRSLAIHQLSAIASLPGTQTRTLTITQYKGQPTPEILMLGPQTNLIVMNCDLSDDGQVRVTIKATKGLQNSPRPPTFSVSFYDMPYIDNTRLTSTVRIAVVLEKFISLVDYKPFIDDIEDPELKGAHKELARINSDAMRQAVLRIIWFPVKYLGLRDRPYLEEVIHRITENSVKN